MKGNAGTSSPIVQYWHSEEIPAEIAVTMSSFRRRNPGMPHLVFSEATAAEFIAERFSRRELAAFRACAVPAMQADYFRYCAVLALGGVYLDADLECVGSLSSLLEMASHGVLFGMPRLSPPFRRPLYEWRERIGPFWVVNNNIFAFKAAGHPLLEIALELSTVNIENRVAENVALTTGPAIFTSLYLLREVGSLEAYIDFVRGGWYEAGAAAFCDLVRELGGREVIDELGRLRIPPLSEAHARWAKPPGEALAYKKAGPDWVRWVNVHGSIFR